MISVVVLYGVFVAIRFQQGMVARPTPNTPLFSARAWDRPWWSLLRHTRVFFRVPEPIFN